MAFDINEKFSALSREEKIMKDYYCASKDPESLAFFMQRTDLTDAGCFIPGVNPAAWEVYTEQNMFPKGGNIQITQHLRYTPEFTHLHTMFEIVYVFKGHCSNTVRNVTQQLKTGDFCIITPNIPHIIGVFDDSLIFNILIKKSTFNETFFKLLAGNHLLSEFFTHIIYTKKSSDYILFHTDGDEIFYNLASDLIGESLMCDEYSDMCMENILMLIFSRLLRYHQEDADIPRFDAAPQSEIITHILQYIDRNYKTVTLNNLASVFNYTAPYVSRLISGTTGRSFSQILTDIKLEKARTLLTSTDMTVNEISDTLGYEDAAYFHRKFRKAMRMTPIEYRNKNRMQK